MNFPKIRKDLEKGITFKIIYRSKPLAELSPMSESDLAGSVKIGDGNRYLPATMEEFLENMDKYSIKGGKPFDAVTLIRKDRGYDK